VFSPRRVVIVSKTWKSDPSQKELIDYCSKAYDGFKKNNCFEDVDVDFLKKLFDGQKMIKDTRPKELHNWLIFFDDQISSNLIKRQDKDPTLKNLFCVGRHYNIWQCWALQRFRATLDPTCRDQFTQIAIFRQGNKQALRDLLADYDESPNLNPKESLDELYRAYLDAVADQDGHGALVINVLTAYGDGRLQKNLGGVVFYDKKNTVPVISPEATGTS